MKYNKGKCSSCNQERYIVKSFYKLCRICNDKRLDAQKENKQENKVSKKNTTLSKRKPTGERELFLALWAVRPHVCFTCSSPLGKEPKAIFFSHIITKKRRPDLRLIPKNIVLECEEHHYSWDFKDWKHNSKLPNFDKKLEVIKSLDEQFYNLILMKLNRI